MDSIDKLLDIIKNILEKNHKSLSEEIAKEFVKEEKFPRDEVKKLIADSFDHCLAQKLKDVSGFFEAQYEKFFTENLTTSYDRVLKQYFSENKSLDRKVTKEIKKYLKEMNFEKTIIEFFNSKKELIMELMLKQIFLEKNIKI